MKNKIASIITIILLCSCQQELDICKPDAGYTPVPVSVNLSGQPSISTKAVIDDDDPPYTPIKDVYILEFDGVADDSKLICYRRIEDYENDSHTVELMASFKPVLVSFLANTCNPLLDYPLGTTLKEYKESSKSVSKEADLFGSGQYMMLNGGVEAEIQSGDELICALKRNIARVDITVRNMSGKTSADGAVVIESVQCLNIPDKSFYCTNYESFPTGNFPEEALGGFIDYAIRDWTDGTEVDGDSETRTFRFYLPVNQSESVSNTHPDISPLFHNKETRFCVNAKYKDVDGWASIRYTFLLGAEKEGAYMICPNTGYEFTFDITSKGNHNTDARIQDYGTLDYTDPKFERANCYILNPPVCEGLTRKFRIPVDRILEFWGNGKALSNKNYEDNESFALTGSSACASWTAEIVWSDIDTNGSSIKISKSDGKGNKDYFEVSVPYGISGNAVVRIVRDDMPDTALWSWHLWITDYQPDDIILLPPSEGVYVYPVTGGAVHRYDNNAFNNGIYKSSFMMDRNLGSVSTGYVPNFGKGCLYYQFGRKDPFPGNAVLYDGNGSIISGFSKSSTKNKSNVAYSINNPFTFILNTPWTSEDKYNTPGQAWLDPYTKPGDTAEKSIFDPCPTGWRIPTNSGTWDNLQLASTKYKDHGRYYYPQSSPDDGKDVIFYPIYGVIYTSGNTSYSDRGFYWSDNDNRETYNAQAFYMTSSYIGNVSGFNCKTIGGSVRCIKDLPRRLYP